MAHKVKRINERPLYLIPVALGMMGVLFSNQLEDPIQQAVVVLFCLAVPLFVGGNLFSHIHSDGFQRTLLAGSLIALTVGSIVSVTGLSERLVDYEYVPQYIGVWSLRLGYASLLLGLLAVMYSVLRSEAIIDQVSDRFRHVADHISEGFVLVDQAGRIILVNNAILGELGMTEDDLVGHSAWELVERLGIDSPDFSKDDLATGGSRSFNITWERKGDQRFYDVTIAPIFDRKRRREGHLFIIRDATEHQRMARRLERYTRDLHELVTEQTREIEASRERLSELLMHMNEGFLTVDENFRIEFANRIVGNMLKANPDEIIGREITDLLPPDQRKRLKKSFRSTSSDEGTTISQEYQFLRSGGGYLPAKISIAKARGEGDEDDHFSVVVTDLQEVKSMQYELEEHAKKLERANNELRELDRAKDTLLSNVSHELRTPLSTIEGYVEMLQSGTLGEVAAPQTGALNVMTRNLDRLAVMINEMIEFSRMEIRGIVLYDTVFNLDILIDEAIGSAHPTAAKKDIELVALKPDVPIDVWGDRGKLSQMLAIFLSNAIKFSHENSRVELGIELNDTRDAVITVRDYGIGIAEENVDMIFEKFYQVDSSMTRHFEGTGIGLSIASNIVKAHGGRIEVESEIEKGTTFRIIFSNSSFDWGSLDKSANSLEGNSIFIINANIEFRDACTRLLTDMGAKVRVFTSGYEAHRVAIDAQPDAVLIGETLPDVTGMQALALFEEHENLSHTVPLLMLTKSQTGEVEEPEISESKLIWKPFSAYELVQKLKGQIPDLQQKSEIA